MTAPPQSADRRGTGLPDGTAAVAAALLVDWAEAVERRTGEAPALAGLEPLEVVLLPELMGEAEAPASPRPAPGGGCLHCDLATDDDEQRFATVVDLAGDGAGAEAVAALAQEWRLAVTPYRRRLAHPHRDPIVGMSSSRAEGTVEPLPERPVVIDLTALWAGPLCTRLLAASGARVVKVDPSCRPDGVRGQPRTYAWLNASPGAAKEIVDLDLRQAADRADFENLVRAADVVVHSFSRRVMPNFGYDLDALQRLRPGLVTVAVHAFPAGRPEAEWVAYGGGVHAASGLGDEPGGGTAGESWWQPVVSYPDPIAGVAAAGAVEELLAGRARGWSVRHAEATLWGAAAAVDRAGRRLTRGGSGG